jgi:hypothetical protein
MHLYLSEREKSLSIGPVIIIKGKSKGWGCWRIKGCTSKKNKQAITKVGSTLTLTQ